MKQRFVRFKTGALLLDISSMSFRRLSEETHSTYKSCIYKVGQTVWVDMPVVEDFIRLFPIVTGK